MLYTMQQLPDMLVQTLLKSCENRPLVTKYCSGTFIAMKEAHGMGIEEAFVLAQAEFYSVAEIQIAEFYESPIGKEILDAATSGTASTADDAFLINFKICGQVVLE